MVTTVKELPEWLWAPAAAAVLSLAIGATGMAAGVPWLFPSLGPTIFLQVHKPSQVSAKPYNVVVGHTLGAAAAIAGVLLFGAGDTPSVLGSNVLSWPRVWASVFAVTATLAAQIPLKASHPPAAATALLIALGGFEVNWHSIWVLTAGVLLTAALGEVLRRLRVGREGR